MCSESGKPKCSKAEYGAIGHGRRDRAKKGKKRVTRAGRQRRQVGTMVQPPLRAMVEENHRV